MSTQKHYSPLVVYLACLSYTLLVFFLFRMVFAVMAANNLAGASAAEFWQALYLGFRFDARLAALVTLPLGVALAVPALARRVTFRLVCLVYALPLFFLVVLYAVDMGFYAYLGGRLDITIWDLLKDLTVSMSMVWQSYPVVWIILGEFACAAAITWGLARLAALPLAHSARWQVGALRFVVGLLVLFVAVYGQITPNMFPLRWSNAYFSQNQHIVALALNPVHNLYDTFIQASGRNYDLEKVREAYPRMAAYLGVDAPNQETLSFSRTTPGRGERPLNVVIIFMESLAYPKTSFAPGGANTTPFIAALAKESVLFHNYYANARTTARAVFSAVTGIPDVSEKSTASRNPLAANQFLLMNEFVGYDKYYMLGGSANWANIRAVFQRNVCSLQVLEEYSWKAPNVDVWGISDFALLIEAHATLAARDQSTPFVAVIQTAGFHRPYTIPPTPGFVLQELPKEQLDLYGFEDQREYNSLRFSDFALGEFMRLARQSPYYENTVFFIFGDHGITDNGRNMPAGYSAAYLAPWHVPLLVHASPALGLLTPGNRHDAASHVDIFATAASLAGIGFENRTLGRNLFDKRFDADRMAFIGGKSNVPLRVVQGQYGYFKSSGGDEHLYRLDDTTGKDLAVAMPELLAVLRQRAEDYVQTARYMLYNNPQKEQ
ncbi:LTA synthase family protein [Desulfovibrio cuneatus]|uniref:LTA synthase family protein n=1 Tax=Desulfovibrio cuneatus TaxID=159728 RepID=UPI0004166EB6|nr:alkaline phosphatase family protein [Desulfovibrio cuneatus]